MYSKFPVAFLLLDTLRPFKWTPFNTTVGSNGLLYHENSHLLFMYKEMVGVHKHGWNRSELPAACIRSKFQKRYMYSDFKRDYV